MAEKQISYLISGLLNLINQFVVFRL